MTKSQLFTIKKALLDDLRSTELITYMEWYITLVQLMKAHGITHSNEINLDA